MFPLVISKATVVPFEIPFIKPFQFAGNIISQRVGFYLTVATSSGLLACGEIAPLPGVSQETLRKARHDLEVMLPFLDQLELPIEKDDLVAQLCADKRLASLCPSVRFGVESAIFSLVAQAAGQALVEFLGGKLGNVSSAGLLQGTLEEVINDAKRMASQGFKVFKLKVGDRNIPLDVKKVQNLRAILGEACCLRLDGNQVWSMSEALLFAQLIGRANIEFIEEPLSDLTGVNKFYQQTHIPVALDETLSLLRCGAQAPGRCGPTLANEEAVKAYIIKPTVLGGVLMALDWMEEARQSGKKAVISATFESQVGMQVLANLALLSGQPAGLGTERWFNQYKPLVTDQGIIPANLLT